MQMHKRIALSALVLTGVTFLSAAMISLPRSAGDIGPGLKGAVIASGVGFMLSLVLWVFVAWPVRD